MDKKVEKIRRLKPSIGPVWRDRLLSEERVLGFKDEELRGKLLSENYFEPNSPTVCGGEVWRQRLLSGVRVLGFRDEELRKILIK